MSEPAENLVFGLREYGIYQLPDGIEVVARSAEGGSIVALFLLADWERFGEDVVMGEAHSSAFKLFHVELSGCIMRLDQRTRWQAYELADTGRTADAGRNGENKQAKG